MTAIEVQRCEKSDLPVGQCGDACCRPDLVEVRFVPVQREGTWREAPYAGTCACGCRRPIAEGDDIILADLVDGDGAWCLLEHTRSALATLGGGH